ncbi:hypothetical protein ICN40_02645 [Polynucleobacter sp. Fuers-14]|nr:hypothetical protein [Polynucleobacter sp. Fuers-14]
MKELWVCNADKMVFKIDRATLEPIGSSVYDAYCFSAPDYEREYINIAEWYELRKAKENA